MKISIIVPAFNEEVLLRESLQQMDAAAGGLRERGAAVEFVVCDNNSTDRTGEMAKDFGATVVREPINQIARARNRGASVATGNWFWFIDADSQPTPELFAAAAEALASKQVVAVGTTLHFENVDPLFRMAASLWKLWSVVFSHMAGSFIAVKADAFRGVGGFSHDFYAGEELDLSRRLSRWGKQQKPRQRVRVLRGVPLRTSGRKARLYGFRENTLFLLRTLVTPFRTLKSREACFIWYDGRRETPAADVADDSRIES